MANPISVLSLFDGISVARIALERAGYTATTYSASEVDEKAIAISTANYGDIRRLGDVCAVDGAEFAGVDLLIGGSPCQDLSRAKRGREGLDGARSGLFWQYVRILREAKPKWFVLENVASMSDADRDVITATLGVAPIMIDAALVSAQSRKRLFWTNIPVGDRRPAGRGIVLADVLEPVFEAKRVYRGGKPFTAEENVRPTASGIVKAGYVGAKDGNKAIPQGNRVYAMTGKSPTLGKRNGVRVLRACGTSVSLSPLESERLQGLPDGYTGCVSDTLRFGAVGNAFNADVVAFILSCIPA